MNARRYEAILLMVFLGGCASTAPQREVRAVLALQKQAEAAYAQGDMAQALSVYRALQGEIPDDDTIWFRLGNIYARLDQSQDAVAAYRQVLQRDASHAKVWHNLGVVLLQQAQEAFTQSEQTVRGDDVLRDRSRAMANAIAGLSHPHDAPPAAGDPAGAEPADVEPAGEELDAHGAMP